MIEAALLAVEIKNNTITGDCVRPAPSILTSMRLASEDTLPSLNFQLFPRIFYRIVCGVLSETLSCQATLKAHRIRFDWTKPLRRLWGLNRRAVSLVAV